MSWAVIARKDFRDARLSRALWGVTAAFVLLSVGFAVLYATVPELRGDIGEVTTIGYLALLMAAVTLFVSIAAIVVAAGSIAGERDSGSSKLLLGFPHSRRDVVIGKFVGRTATLASGLLVGIAITLVVAFALFTTVRLDQFALFTALTLVLVLAYVGIMVGISAFARTGGRAMAAGFGAFVFLELITDVIPTGALFVVNGFTFAGIGTYPGWAAFLTVAAPSAAYSNAIMWFLNGQSMGAAAMGLAPSATIPFYLTGWVSLLLLGSWLVVPLTVGYWRFARADI